MDGFHELQLPLSSSPSPFGQNTPCMHAPQRRPHPPSRSHPPHLTLRHVMHHPMPLYPLSPNTSTPFPFTSPAHYTYASCNHHHAARTLFPIYMRHTARASPPHYPVPPVPCSVTPATSPFFTSATRLRILMSL